jgi:hypothetical protein
MVGDMVCADEDFGSEVGQMWLKFILLSQNYLYIYQMILSEPSNIIIWTYQDMMDG